MTERSILVPEVLDGQRVDSALSKLLGLSRTAAADICAAAEGGGHGDGVGRGGLLGGCGAAKGTGGGGPREAAGKLLGCIVRAGAAAST